MNATSIYNELQTSLKKGERVAVVTVVKTVGAAPCAVGTKMLVRADGTTYGTFSGPNIDGRVSDSLHINDDTVGLRVAPQVINQVAPTDIYHRANGDKGTESNVFAQAPIKHGGTQGTALADEANMSG